MTSKIDNVSVVTQANVFFDGKCVSHTIFLPDGSRKSVGVILPATLVFNTGAAEIMELVAGNCRVKLKGESEAKNYGAGDSFTVAPNSGFEIEALEIVHYVCHFS